MLIRIENFNNFHHKPCSRSQSDSVPAQKPFRLGLRLLLHYRETRRLRTKGIKAKATMLVVVLIKHTIA